MTLTCGNGLDWCTLPFMKSEHWLFIPGYVGLYQVSDQGRVRSLSRRHSVQPGGTAVVDAEIVVPHKRSSYQGVSLIGKQGGSRAHYVHRLVLEAFVGPCPPGMETRHLNGDPSDNRLVNLAWGTPSENNLDRVKHGTHQHTKRTHCPKGHPLDGVRYNKDGTVKQRRCMTCNRALGKARRARKTHCPKGHPFDGVRYNADGTIRQRYCTVCAHAALAEGLRTRWG
jgi:hypothetical protein